MTRRGPRLDPHSGGSAPRPEPGPRQPCGAGTQRPGSPRRVRHRGEARHQSGLGAPVPGQPQRRGPRRPPSRELVPPHRCRPTAERVSGTADLIHRGLLTLQLAYATRGTRAGSRPPRAVPRGTAAVPAVPAAAGKRTPETRTRTGGDGVTAAGARAPPRPDRCHPVPGEGPAYVAEDTELAVAACVSDRCAPPRPASACSRPASPPAADRLLCSTCSPTRSPAAVAPKARDPDLETPGEQATSGGPLTEPPGSQGADGTTDVILDVRCEAAFIHMLRHRNPIG